jgi:hypothetical protein
MAIGCLITLVGGFILIRWWLHSLNKPVGKDPGPLDKTCLKCGRKTVEISKPRLKEQNFVYNLRCTACGYDNLPPGLYGNTWHLIEEHNKNVAQQRFHRGEPDF